MPHQTPELCANPDCHHGRSLHVANRMNCCVVSCSCNHYVEEETDYNELSPEASNVIHVPRTPGTENTPLMLEAVLGDAPKALHCICDSKPGQAHHFECPLSLSEPVKYQSEILHQEPVRFVSLSAVNIRLLALDRDGQLWASLYSGLPDKLKWYRCNMPVKD